MLKHTPEDLAEYAALQEVYQRITAMNQLCNDIVRPHQDRRELAELQQSLDMSRLASEVDRLTLAYLASQTAAECGAGPLCVAEA